MTSLLGKFFPSTNRRRNTEEHKFVDLYDSEKPYILTEVYYLLVIFFIGIPMWFLTCSSSQYSLPQTNVELTKPRLHLDISVVRLTTVRANLHSDDHDYYDNLRGHLQNQLGTLGMSNVTYNIEWRVRRPTVDENRLFKSVLDEKPAGLDSLLSLEQGLTDLHKQSYKFRILMFLLDSKFCNDKHNYIFGSEPFVYLCPSDDQSALIGMIRFALEETYLNSINTNHIKRILIPRTNLQVTLVRDVNSNNVQELSRIANQFHEIYHDNLKKKFIELPEIVNIRFITQNLYDFPYDNIGETLQSRGGIEDFFRYFTSRIDEPLEDDVHHVAAIILNTNSTPEGLLVETPDSHFVLHVTNEQSIFNGLRAIVRRVIGLKSTTMCKNCLVRGDVFLNKWELDVLISTLTAIKLQSVHITIESLGKLKQIPKLVSVRAHEAHRYALGALGYLESRRPLEAYRFASASYELAEKAYYDPSLVDTSNEFPDENKYAVYLPLFLPLALPVLASIIRVVKYMFSGSTSPKTKVD